MNYNYRYRIRPSDNVATELRRHIDTCRQLYNHCLYVLNESDDTPARYEVQGTLPELKQWWDDLKNVHSKVLQMVVKCLYDNLSTLRERKKRIPRRSPSVETTTGIPFVDLQSDWLQARKQERPADVVALENR